MKFGLRKPFIRKRLAARTSLKRYARHRLGLKAPAGFGWVTNPKRAAYNRVYQRTTAGLNDLVTDGTGKSARSSPLATVLLTVLILYVLVKVFF